VSAPRVSAAEALALQRIGYTIVDLRPPFDFNKGHPAGARNVPFYFYTDAGGVRDNPDFLSVMTSLFPRDAKLVVLDKLGTRSPKAVEALVAAGYQDVRDVLGGFKGMVGAEGRRDGGWEPAGLPYTLTHEAGYAELVESTKKPKG
jgi:rhodanese-related sulfurtransferase